MQFKKELKHGLPDFVCLSCCGLMQFKKELKLEMPRNNLMLVLVNGITSKGGRVKPPAYFGDKTSGPEASGME